MSPARRFAVVLAVGVLASCAPRDAGEREPVASTAEWQRLPDGPLTPRYGAHAVWTGGEVLILGGRDDDPCPPSASCVPSGVPPLRDGAAFDPATGTWRRLPDAPVPLGWINSSAVIDDRVYVLVHAEQAAPGVRRAFLSLHLATGRWRELEHPPTPDARLGYRLLAAGDRVVAYWPSQELGVHPDLVFDPGTETWTELPSDPLVPSFDRGMVWTGREAVLLGIENVPQPGSSEPAVYRAAALNASLDAWRRLPDSDVIGWDPQWYWVAERVVNPSLEMANGGENEWGRTYHSGGILDPAAGRWTELPDRPAGHGGYRGPSVGGDGYVMSPRGWVLHVPTGSWTRLPSIDGGPDQDQASVWAGDWIVVWGGVRWAGNEGRLIADGWSWTPQGA